MGGKVGPRVERPQRRRERRQLLARGTLCRLDEVHAEVHDERVRAFRPLVHAAGAPPGFGATLGYMLKQAGADGCKVKFHILGHAGSGS